MNNPVNKGFRIPKKPVKETTVEEAQNIDVQIKNSENIMENLVKPEESTANDAQWVVKIFKKGKFFSEKN